MKKVTLLFFVLLTIISTVGCNKKTSISQDNMTDGLSIETIALSDDEQISEGNIYFVEGNFSTAIDYYSQAQQKNKALALYNIGVSYYLLGDIAKAEQNFREAVAAEPNFDEAIMNLVAVLAQQEKIEEAEKYISQIIYTNKSPRVYVDMANISLRQNNTSQAAFYYNKALEVAPNSDFVRSNYANFLISIGEYLDGVDILESIDDKDFPIYYNLAYAYYKLKDNVVASRLAMDAFYSNGATEEGYNKLAYLLSDMGEYDDEIEVLNTLLRTNPTKDYKIRVITAYINLSLFNEALDELATLLQQYPDDVTLYVLNYEVLIMASKLIEGGNFIKAAYNKFKDDITLYYYTKYLALFTESAAPVKSLIFNNKNNGWLNLARTVYYLSLSDYKLASQSLDKVPESAGHDYYSYKTFLAIIDKRYSEAELYTAKMDATQYDTFWYKLVVAWNLRDTNELLAITNKYQDSAFIYTRTPNFKYSLVPQLVDMSYTFGFDGNEFDIASMMMYPLFLEPDEVVQFLVVGRSVLKESERQNATNRLEGTKRNNEGLDAFYTYKFEDAIEKFNEAIKHLPNTPEAIFNQGVAYFNIGDNVNAMRSFENAIAVRESSPYAYLGMSLVHYRRGNIDLTLQNLETARRLLAAEINDSIEPKLDTVRYYYLATLASDRFDRRTEANNLVSSDDAYVQTIDTFMQYTETKDVALLSTMKNSPVFRAPAVAELIEIDDNPRLTNTLVNDDRYYEIAKMYVLMKNGIKPSLTINQKFAKDQVYLKDMVYVSMFEDNLQSGLRYLQLASNIDFSFLELYKVSLYYFIWARDFVNAEASYGSLDRSAYEDQTALFYKLLYFLVNYNEPRLEGVLSSYIESYGEDYRSSVISSLVNLNIKNVTAFYVIMSGLIASDPELFDKMFIEVNFEKF